MSQLFFRHSLAIVCDTYFCIVATSSGINIYFCCTTFAGIVNKGVYEEQGQGFVSFHHSRRVSLYIGFCCRCGCLFDYREDITEIYIFYMWADITSSHLNPFCQHIVLAIYLMSQFLTVIHLSIFSSLSHAFDKREHTINNLNTGTLFHHSTNALGVL